MSADQDKGSEDAEASSGAAESEAGIDAETGLEEACQLAEERLDQLLRCRAELDNTLKRVAREKEELARYASETLVVKLLPVLDSLDQASKHDQGAEQIRQQLTDVLKSEGLSAIEALGEKFDPYQHEALMQVPAEEHEDGTVIEEVLRGYTLGPRVVRFSKVLVSKRKET